LVVQTINKPNTMNTATRTRRTRKGAFGHSQVRMDDSVYLLRRQVIEVIYAANSRLSVRLPRLEVRVVDGGDCQVLGYAVMGGKVVHIPKDTFGRPCLLQVVLHEILHAVLSTEHDEDCRLMSAYVDHTLTDDEAWELFLGYF